MEPLINILTRTSNRPVYFSINRQSIISQTYNNVNHIVSCDNRNDLKYIEKEGFDDLIYINENSKIKLKQKFLTNNLTEGRFFLPELYINKLLENVNEGWVLVLDDDDVFFDENSLEKIVKEINDADIIFWRMIWKNGRIIPSDKNFYNYPVLNDIGSPCFMFHSKFKDHFVWSPWSGSDYRALVKIWKHTIRKKYINEVLIKIPKQGFGKKEDIYE